MKKFLSDILIKLGIAVVVMIGIVYLVIYLLDTSSKAIKDIAGDFGSARVVNEFNSYITKLEGNNRLQVASIKSIDKFSKKDSQSILWDLIALPDVVVELQAPVEYTYFLDLKDKWEFAWGEQDSSITVIAPLIQCGTPAVDVSKMQITEKEGSFLRDVEAVKEKLQSELSDKLKIVAVEKIPLIIETARVETKHFIHNWFLKYYFKDGEFKPGAVKIYFADETSPIRKPGIIKLDKKE